MLRPELEDDFLALADADLAASEAGQREQFALSRAMDRHGARLIHPHSARNLRIAVPDLQEMHDEGLIDLQLLPKGRGTLRVKAEGHRYANQIRARGEQPSQPSEAGALDWDREVFPVLEAVYRAYSSAPTPGGVEQRAINEHLDRAPDDKRTDRVLGELAASGYLEATAGSWQTAGPLRSKLTDKGLQQVAGWPSGPGDALARALLKALDERIEAAGTQEERAGLERLREAATSVGVNTLSSVLAKLATGGL